MFSYAVYGYHNPKRSANGWICQVGSGTIFARTLAVSGSSSITGMRWGRFGLHCGGVLAGSPDSAKFLAVIMQHFKLENMRLPWGITLSDWFKEDEIGLIDISPKQ